MSEAPCGGPVEQHRHGDRTAFERGERARRVKGERRRARAGRRVAAAGRQDRGGSGARRGRDTLRCTTKGSRRSVRGHGTAERRRRQGHWH